MFGKDNSYIYFSGESNITINVVTPDDLVDNSASLEFLYVKFYAESLYKRQKKNYNFT